jgi:flagellar hook-associated protein 3 FlgL
MRVTDYSIQRNYLMNLNRNKNELSKIQEQITTGKKVNRPSDSPLSAARIIRYNALLGDISTYQSNTTYASAFVNKTSTTIESIQDTVLNMQSDLVSLNNNLEVSSYSNYSQKFEDYLNELIDYANADYDGKYIFSGTELSTKPFSIDSSASSVSLNSSNIGGSYNVKISNSTNQRINIPGDELFGSVLKTTGNFDVNAATGTSTNLTNTVYDDNGNVYDVSMIFTKTSSNNYSLQYSITDSSSNVVTSGTHTLGFNSATGVLTSVDGGSPSKIKIEVGSPQIRMFIDTTNLSEKNAATSISQSQKIKGDIFSTLISIKDGLKNGVAPNANQIKVVNDFYSLVLDKASDIGNISNRISNISDQMSNEEIEINSLLSTESDTDIAQAAIDLQNKQVTMEYAYKISSLILPKSLLDYL